MTTEELLSTGIVMDLNDFLAATAFPPESFVLLEQVPRSVLTNREDRKSREEREELLRFIQLGKGVDLSMSTSGRIFHRDFELRWDRGIPGIPEPTAAQVVYVGKAETLPAELSPGQKLDMWHRGLQPCSRGYFLFGTLLDTQQMQEMGLSTPKNLYAELRVPRLLSYPVRAQRLRLVVREYVEASTGRVQLLRFEGLEPGKEGQHESL